MRTIGRVDHVEDQEERRCYALLGSAIDPLATICTADRLQRVVEQLRVMLKDGPRLSREIHDEARRGQVPRLLLFAAKEQLGVRAFYDGRERQWRWGMPAGRADSGVGIQDSGKSEPEMTNDQ